MYPETFVLTVKSVTTPLALCKAMRKLAPSSTNAAFTLVVAEEALIAATTPSGVSLPAAIVTFCAGLLPLVIANVKPEPAFNACVLEVKTLESFSSPVAAIEYVPAYTPGARPMALILSDPVTPIVILAPSLPAVLVKAKLSEPRHSARTSVCPD